MKKSLLFSAVLSIVLLAGCVKENDVTFHGVDDVKISYKGNIKIEVLAHIENEAGSNITLKEASMWLTDKSGNRLTELVFPEKVVVPKRSDGIVSIPMYIKNSNLFGVLALVGEIGDNPDNVFVEGKVVVRAGLMRKKFKLERMTLQRFVSYVGGGDIGDYIDDFMDML